MYPKTKLRLTVHYTVALPHFSSLYPTHGSLFSFSSKYTLFTKINIKNTPK